MKLLRGTITYHFNILKAKIQETTSKWKSPFGYYRFIPVMLLLLKHSRKSHRLFFRAWVRKWHHQIFLEKRIRDPVMCRKQIHLEWTQHVQGPFEHVIPSLSSNLQAIFNSLVHYLWCLCTDKNCVWLCVYFSKKLFVKTGCRLYFDDPALGFKLPCVNVQSVWLKLRPEWVEQSDVSLPPWVRKESK